MLKFKSFPFEEDIEKATHENNLTEDWSLIMLICDNAINYQDGAKYCLKAILKRLHHNVPRVVLQTLTLLDACVKNCDRRFLLQVASSEFTTEVRKLLAKMHPSAATKLKELLQKWSNEEFKDDPELCIIPSLYYKLKSEGIEFPPLEKEKKQTPSLCTNPDVVSSQEEENDIMKAIEISLKDTGRYDVGNDYMNSTVAPVSKTLPEPFKVRTLYDFEAAEDNELTIKVGEIVLVLDNSNSSWWKGSNHRGEGLFPANFVTEDLDFKPEEPAVTTVDSKQTEASSDIAGDHEVKLDEEKIETVLNWLNDTDPTGELPDPEEMLLMERECLRMTPLIEENLQSIDNRMAMLNLVNEKIMAAFDLFHSLSDQWSSVNPTAKYFPSESYGRNMARFPAAQVHLPAVSVMCQTFQPLSNQQQYASAMLPSTYAVVNSQTNCHSVSTGQTPISHQPQISMVNNVNEISTSKNTEASQSFPPKNSEAIQVSNSASMSSNNTMNSSTMPTISASSASGYFIPSQAMQYPVPHIQHQSYVQASGPVPNFMTIPYPMPSVGPYFPFPCYYVNSNLPPQSTVTSAPTVNPQENGQSTPCSSASAEPVTTVVANVPSYSNDLQHLNFTNPSPSSNGPNEKQMTTSNSINQSLGEEQLQTDICAKEQS